MARVARNPRGTAREGEAEAIPKSRRELIRSLLEKVEQGFNPKETRVTLADFIRLTQLERELDEQEQPREIIVTWSEPPER